jgi:alpha-maltose-1-phosphate synthase
MRVALLTREYPPFVYGGAGIHVDYLSRELAKLVPVEVRCFGSRPEPEVPMGGPAVVGYERAPGTRSSPVIETLLTDIEMIEGLGQASLVHTHTWYTALAGRLARLMHGIPHVLTAHSLEPLRPWKADQLGIGGYAVSSFCERTAIEAADAVIAVSSAMKTDVLASYPDVGAARLHVIRNGVDPDEYQPTQATDVLERYGVDPGKPYVIFVGRITHQKGILHLLEAVAQLDPRFTVVLCAGAPDTEAIGREVAARVDEVSKTRGNIIWIDAMLPKREIVQLYSHATVFVCPSIYEPLGIVNLEAMACETAVVATATGGIPEVVEDQRTGLLVSYEPQEGGSWRPRDPERFASDLAGKLEMLLTDPALAERMGKQGRERVLKEFTWERIAEQTLDLYRSLAT